MEELTAKADDDMRHVANRETLREMEHAWDFPASRRAADQGDAVAFGEPLVHPIPPALGRLQASEMRHRLERQAEHGCQRRLQIVAHRLPELRATPQDGLCDADEAQVLQPNLSPRPGTATWRGKSGLHELNPLTA
jgi:hypothetical protein